MIIALVGQVLLLLALAATVVMAVAGLVAARTGARLTGPWGGLDASVLAGRAAAMAFQLSLAASILLLGALVFHDFDLAYVAGRTNETLPLPYRISAFWSGQEGSLLLWLLVLCGYGLLMRRSLECARVPGRMQAAATGTVGVVAAFFAMLVALVARPFALVATRVADGSGMSPALQNYWMALHPPALYAGYIGVTVPFAIIVGALLAGSSSDAWAPLARRWALVAWVGLTLGLLLGARWAYEEIGWGGYWGWDPVENAALMPWLTITAFIHSITVQQRRGMMRWWNVLLISLTFCLSIFGTFLTRSGVLSSVHSFVSSEVGWWFIGFLAFAVAASMALLYRVRARLAADGDVDSVVSRETAYLLNNLLLVAIALTVLWGVVYPILSAAFGFGRVSLQAPWYNFFTVAFGLPLLAIMAAGPVVPWRGGQWRKLMRDLVVPVSAGALVGAVLVATGNAASAAGVAAVSFGIVVLVGIVEEFRNGIAARRGSSGRVGAVAAVAGLFRRNRRRYGGYVAHAGIGLMVIAIAGSSAWQDEQQRVMKPGDRLRVGAWTLRYEHPTRRRTENHMMVRARFDLLRGSEKRGSVSAGRNFYPASGEISNEVGIHHDWLRGGDVFVIVDRLEPDGTAQVKALINPLVMLLWLAGLMVAAGGIIAAWPSAAADSASRLEDARPDAAGQRVPAKPA